MGKNQFRILRAIGVSKLSCFQTVLKKHILCNIILYINILLGEQKLLVRFSGSKIYISILKLRFSNSSPPLSESVLTWFWFMKNLWGKTFFNKRWFLSYKGASFHLLKCDNSPEWKLPHLWLIKCNICQRKIIRIRSGDDGLVGIY